MKKLVLSYADPAKWRRPAEGKNLQTLEWKTTRLKILTRDDYTCQYCSYRTEKFQIIDHIDGNPNNNKDSNLQTICQMCNLIKHAGQGCVVKGIVDLYSESKYSQNEIISFLSLKHKVPFKMDKKYLRQLYGFVTSRSTLFGDDMYDRWKDYHNEVVRRAR